MKKKYRKKALPVIRDIYLFNEIEPKIIQETIEQIINVRKKTTKPINLYINSPGGFCDSGFALIDVIIKHQPIRTIALGEICSMACPIFLAGEERYISDNTFVMFHPVACGANDYVNFAKARIKNAEVTEKMYDNFVLNNCNIPRDIYEKAKNSELWLTAQEALSYKIALKKYEGGLK